MTPRSRIYLNYKKAFRLIGTPAGRAKLAALGIHPMSFSISSSSLPASYRHGYFIDNKGRIVGSSQRPPRETKKVWVNLPPIEPHRIEFKFASPELLANMPNNPYFDGQNQLHEVPLHGLPAHWPPLDDIRPVDHEE